MASWVTSVKKTGSTPPKKSFTRFFKLYWGKAGIVGAVSLVKKTASFFWK